MIFAANHRSFLDPFVIGDDRAAAALLRGQGGAVPQPLVGWLLNSLGAFPVRRGAGDDGHDRHRAGDPRARRRRPDLPRGHAHPPRRARPPEARRRPPRAGDRRARRPRRGDRHRGDPPAAGASARTRSASASAAPLTFPQVERRSPQLAAAVTDRIWPCVMLQWEWLGGLPPLRRAAVIGAGSWGTGGRGRARPRRPRGRPRLPHRASRPTIAARRPRQRRTTCPASSCPTASTCVRAAELELVAPRPRRASPSPPRALPAARRRPRRRDPARARRARARQGPRRRRSGTLPGAYVAERISARARRPPRRPRPRRRRARPRRLARRRPRRRAASRRQLADVARRRRPRRRAARATSSASSSPAAAKNAAALAAAAAAAAGPNAAGAAAGKVFAEVDALARRRGARPETFAGLAGAGDLVATVVADGSRNRRAGELLGRGVPAERDRRRARPDRRGARRRCRCWPARCARRRGRADRRRPGRRRRGPRRRGALDRGRHRPRRAAKRAAGGVGSDAAIGSRALDKAQLDASSPSSTGRTCATSTPTRTTGWATTTTPRTSPSRRSCRPTGTSSGRRRESDGRPLRPWLIRIAHNLAANLYRDRSRRPQTPIDDTTRAARRRTRPRTSSRAATSWRGSSRASRSCPTTAARR